jgi:hypothetical protein
MHVCRYGRPVSADVDSPSPDPDTSGPISVIGTSARWPTSTDYSSAIQNAQSAFSDRNLQRSAAATNMLGMPLVASGQNAVVYLLRGDDEALAVRCFTTPPRDGAVRYAALLDHLATVPHTALATSRWVEDGILVGERHWPVVVMPWVEGRPLNLVVDDAVDEPDELRRLADGWMKMVVELQEADVTHGDLQHGNVLVRADGSYCLVDLDGVWVPTMTVGAPAESGHPNYQHPDRSEEQWDRHGDSFPALVIETGLRALAADRSLERFLSGENLLFSRADLLDPTREVWQVVFSSPDADVARLVAILRQRAREHPAASMLPYTDLRSGRSAPAPPPVLRAGTPLTRPPSVNEAERTPAGWHPDPRGQGSLRYWDGTNWTDHVVTHAPIAATPIPTTKNANAQWFPDPTGRFEFRYWNGTKWTRDVSTNGQTSVDRPVM